MRISFSFYLFWLIAIGPWLVLAEGLVPSPQARFPLDGNLTDTTGQLTLTITQTPTRLTLAESDIHVSARKLKLASEARYNADRHSRPGSALAFELDSDTESTLTFISPSVIRSESKSIAVWVNCHVPEQSPVASVRQIEPESQLVNTKPSLIFWGHVIPATKICDRAWHHIIYSATKATLTLFIDGKTATSLTAKVRSRRRRQQLGVLLSISGCRAYPFIGALDDIQIWEAGLTIQHVASLYQMQQNELLRPSSQLQSGTGVGFLSLRSEHLYSNGASAGTRLYGSMFLSTNGKLWSLFGRWAPGYQCQTPGKKQVGWSLDNGATWTYAAESTITGIGVDYLYQSSAAIFNGRLILAGGTICNQGYHKKVWYSQDGLFWNQVQPTWAGRCNSAMVVVQNRLYIIGGHQDQSLSREIWFTYDPTSPAWIPAPDGPWTSPGDPQVRWPPTVAVTSTNRIVNIVNKEIWISDILVSSWTQITPQATEWFGPRSSGSLINSQGNLFYIGGISFDDFTKVYNDVWVSMDEGQSWMLVTSNGNFPPRVRQGALVNGNALIVLGGNQPPTIPGPHLAGSVLADVWVGYI